MVFGKLHIHPSMAISNNKNVSNVRHGNKQGRNLEAAESPNRMRKKLPAIMAPEVRIVSAGMTAK